MQGCGRSNALSRIWQTQERMSKRCEWGGRSGSEGLRFFFLNLDSSCREGPTGKEGQQQKGRGGRSDEHHVQDPISDSVRDRDPTTCIDGPVSILEFNLIAQSSALQRPLRVRLCGNGAAKAARECVEPC